MYVLLVDEVSSADLQEASCNCDGGPQEMLCSNCEDSRGVGNLKQQPSNSVQAAGSKTKTKPGGKFEMNWTVDLDARQ